MFSCAACQKTDYTQYVSDLKSEIFSAETDDYRISIACLRRETPYLADGYVSPQSMLMEIVLVPSVLGGSYSATAAIGEGKEIGGDMSLRLVTGDYYYSCGVDAFPKEQVSVTVTGDDGTKSLTATALKGEKTISWERALECAVEAERETVESRSERGVFCGEFRVRLLSRDRLYYYVGIVDRDGKTLSLLLDDETGEVLATHTSP